MVRSAVLLGASSSRERLIGSLARNQRRERRHGGSCTFRLGKDGPLFSSVEETRLTYFTLSLCIRRCGFLLALGLSVLCPTNAAAQATADSVPIWTRAVQVGPSLAARAGALQRLASRGIRLLPAETRRVLIAELNRVHQEMKSGILVTATEFRAYGAVANDQGTGFQVRVTPTRQVAVNPRRWTFAPRPGPSAQPDPVSSAPPQLAALVTPPLASDVIPGSGNPAVTDLGKLTINSGDVTYLSTGPNARIAYLSVVPTLPRSHWWRNRDLESGSAWRADQNGGTDPVFGTARCDSTQVPVFIQEIERHEGVGLAPNSHQGINGLADALLASTVEEVVAFGPTAATADSIVRARAPVAYHGRLEQLTGAQHAALHVTDIARWYTPAPTGIFPCRWDFISRDK